MFVFDTKTSSCSDENNCDASVRSAVNRLSVNRGSRRSQEHTNVMSAGLVRRRRTCVRARVFDLIKPSDASREEEVSFEKLQE
ncbi:Hypothetical protein SMAX5B_008044 [Scophthalmus maximus]|uniref:Uncharacterized protein n=1 Tax=Scophthalmus maximus TaxID=52904 RepID=A0A2U9BE52_SCOMX|nr:Hypothetical protein SMAX5B_008044 [Scophthalmus maximus]KAF0035616.1 hypothetical protein F2P81_013374 [Scophthalmus maximus]